MEKEEKMGTQVPEVENIGKAAEYISDYFYTATPCEAIIRVNKAQASAVDIEVC